MKKGQGQSRRFYSKLLLFGEYTIIKGSGALAMPYRALGGEWMYLTGEENRAPQENLPAFAAHLAQLARMGQLQQSLGVKQFAEDLAAGLYFSSDIPRGYGLGSSGALCAAVYDRYVESRSDDDPAELRKMLAQMEGFFHGSSSGTDPLICYLDRPVKLHPDGRVEPVRLPAPGDVVLFLLDTGISRQTGPLVEVFLRKNKEKTYREKQEAQLIPSTDQAIECFQAGDWGALQAAFREVSAFQLDHFAEMIPPAFRPAWQRGLTEGDFLLKLCGAGGGGFLLGMTFDWEGTRKQLCEFPLRRVFPED